MLKAPRPSTYNPNPNMHEPTPKEQKYKLCKKNTLEYTITATNKSNLEFNTKKHDWKNTGAHVIEFKYNT